jgi:hypothetical protein
VISIRKDEVKKALEAARKYIKRGYVNAEGAAVIEQIDAAIALVTSQKEPER